MTTRLARMTTSAVLLLAGCDDILGIGPPAGIGPGVDACGTCNMIDGSHIVDGPGVETLIGLGEKCGSGGVATCPSSAPLCLSVNQAQPYCSATCVTGATGTTLSDGSLPDTGVGHLTPPRDTAACMAAASGGDGIAMANAQCGILLMYTPMDMPIMANKAYTGIQMACFIQCTVGQGNVCPTGMSCSMESNGFGICIPN